MDEVSKEPHITDAAKTRDYASSLLGVDTNVTPRVTQAPAYMTDPWKIFSFNEFHFKEPLRYVALNEWNRWDTNSGEYLYTVRTCGWVDADNPERIYGTSCFSQEDDMIRQGAAKVSEEWAENFRALDAGYSFMLQETDADWVNPAPPATSYPFHEFVLLVEFELSDVDQAGKIDAEVKAATEGGRLGRRTVVGHPVTPWETADWTAASDGDGAAKAIESSYRGKPNTRNYYIWFSKQKDADAQNATGFFKDLKQRHAAIIDDMHVTRMITWLDWGRGTFDHDALPPLPQPK